MIEEEDGAHQSTKQTSGCVTKDRNISHPLADLGSYHPIPPVWGWSHWRSDRQRSPEPSFVMISSVFGIYHIIAERHWSIWFCPYQSVKTEKPFVSRQPKTSWVGTDFTVVAAINLTLNTTDWRVVMPVNCLTTATTKFSVITTWGQLSVAHLMNVEGS